MNSGQLAKPRSSSIKPLIMTKFTLKYLDANHEVAGQQSVITCKNQSEAVLQFTKEEPASFPFIAVAPFEGGRRHLVDNPLAGQIAKKEAEFQAQVEESQRMAEREQAEAERLAEVELLKKIIIAADTPLQLSFSQLEFLIENFNLFPTLERGDEEIYSLREKLYILSFWNTAFQSSLQTRLLSQIASVTSTPQKGTSSKSQNKPLAAASVLAASVGLRRMGEMNETLDEIAEDTEEVGDFFGD
ncbi:hypothetical protein OAA12_00860 [Akkermansiaceae bacterium]|nr:hypothetical protein [Akkermansiaceae bacterium]